MTEEFPYVEERLESQRKWHSSAATKNKNRYYMVEIIVLVAGALIPVVNVLVLLPPPWLRLVSASLGATIVIVGGLGKLFKFQENWLSFRTLSEVLKRETEFYRHRLGEYAGKSGNARDRLLVERTEDFIAATTGVYFALHERKHEEAEPPPPPQGGEATG